MIGQEIEGIRIPMITAKISRGSRPSAEVNGLTALAPFYFNTRYPYFLFYWFLLGTRPATKLVF